MSTPEINRKKTPPLPSGRHGKRPGGKSMEIAEKRRELMRAECARRGVRFLPGQVLREIYERNGLL
jgi:hypothetical protein